MSKTTITGADVRTFTIPTSTPESDGTSSWDSTTVLVVELTAEDKRSLGYSYISSAAASIADHLLVSEVIGKDISDIPFIHHHMNRSVRNMGLPGVASCAIAAIDNSLWDLKARLLNLPIVDLLGRARSAIAGYGSGGFTSYSLSTLVDQLTGWAASGYSAVKMKIGRHREEDVSRVKQVQSALHGAASLFVDANGAYSRRQALEKAKQFGDLGVVWFEEPVSSDNRTGLHSLVEHAPPALQIAAGEYGYTLDDFRLLIEADAVDVLQADVTRCGGVSNFLKVAALCESYHLPLSAHTAPALHASLCCAVVPAINVECFYDHMRIENMIFEGAVQAKNGMLQPDAERPGFGLELKLADSEPFCLSHSHHGA